MKNNQIKAGVVISYISLIINCGISIFLTPFIVRSLGNEQYGIYRTVSSVIAYLTVCKFGLGNAVIRYIAAYRAHHDQKREAELLLVIKRLNLMASLFTVLIGFIIYAAIPGLFGTSMTKSGTDLAQQLFALLIIGVILSIINDLYDSVISAYEEYFFQRILELVKNIIRAALIVALLTYSPSAVMLTLTDVFLNGIILVSNYIKCRKMDIVIHGNLSMKELDFKYYRGVLGFSLYVLLNTVINQLIWNTDAIIIGMRLPSEKAAVYGVGAVISNLFYTLSIVIANFQVPSVVGMIEKGAQKEDLTELMIRVGRYQSYMVFFLLSLYFAFGRQFMALWMGNGFDEAWSTSLLVMLGMIFASLTVTGHTILKALNKQAFFMWSYFAALIANVIATYYVVPAYGINGAAAMTMITFILVNLLMVYPYYQKCIGLNIIRFCKGLCIRIVPVSVILGVTANKIAGRIDLRGWGAFLAACIVYTAVYIVISWMLFLDVKEKKVWIEWWRRVSRKC